MAATLLLGEFGRFLSEEYMQTALLPHQINSVRWLLMREEFPYYGVRGGINAKDPGMGKTLEMLTLILSDRLDDPKFVARVPSTVNAVVPATCIRTTVVVVDNASRGSWNENIRQHFKPNTFRCRTIDKKDNDLQKDLPRIQSGYYDIIFINYSILGCLYTRNDEQALNLRDEPRFIALQVKWRRVIADEVHCIRTPRTASSKALRLVQSDRRWGMTGTPMHNNLSDYASLYAFLGLRHSTIEQFSQANHDITDVSKRFGITPQFCANANAILMLFREKTSPADRLGPQEKDPALLCKLVAAVPLAYPDMISNCIKDPARPWELDMLRHSPQVQLTMASRMGMMRDRNQLVQTIQDSIAHSMPDRVWLRVAMFMATSIDTSDMFNDGDAIYRQLETNYANAQRLGIQCIQTYFERLDQYQSAATAFVNILSNNNKTPPTNSVIIPPPSKKRKRAARLQDMLPGYDPRPLPGMPSKRQKTPAPAATPEINKSSISTDIPLGPDALLTFERSMEAHSAEHAIYAALERYLLNQKAQLERAEATPRSTGRRELHDRIIACMTYAQEACIHPDMLRVSSDDGKALEMIEDDAQASHYFRQYPMPPLNDSHRAEFIKNAHRRLVSTKMRMLKEYIVNSVFSDEKVVVYSRFTWALYMMGQFLHDTLCVGVDYMTGEHSPEERERIIRRFWVEPATKFKVLLASIKANAQSVNLARANHVIVIDQWLNPRLQDQAIERIRRQGQTRTPYRSVFLIADSFESVVYRVAAEKTGMCFATTGVESHRRKHILDARDAHPVDALALLADNPPIQIITSHALEETSRVNNFVMSNRIESIQREMRQFSRSRLLSSSSSSLSSSSSSTDAPPDWHVYDAATALDTTLDTDNELAALDQLTKMRKTT